MDFSPKRSIGNSTWSPPPLSSYSEKNLKIYDSDGSISHFTQKTVPYGVPLMCIGSHNSYATFVEIPAKIYTDETKLKPKPKPEQMNFFEKSSFDTNRKIDKNFSSFSQLSYEGSTFVSPMSPFSTMSNLSTQSTRSPVSISSDCSSLSEYSRFGRHSNLPSPMSQRPIFTPTPTTSTSRRSFNSNMAAKGSISMENSHHLQESSQIDWESSDTTSSDSNRTMSISAKSFNMCDRPPTPFPFFKSFH